MVPKGLLLALAGSVDVSARAVPTAHDHDGLSLEQIKAGCSLNILNSPFHPECHAAAMGHSVHAGATPDPGADTHLGCEFVGHHILPCCLLHIFGTTFHVGLGCSDETHGEGSPRDPDQGPAVTILPGPSSPSDQDFGGSPGIISVVPSDTSPSGYSEGWPVIIPVGLSTTRETSAVPSATLGQHLTTISSSSSRPSSSLSTTYLSTASQSTESLLPTSLSSSSSRPITSLPPPSTSTSRTTSSPHSSSTPVTGWFTVSEHSLTTSVAGGPENTRSRTAGPTSSSPSSSFSSLSTASQSTASLSPSSRSSSSSRSSTSQLTTSQSTTSGTTAKTSTLSSTKSPSSHPTSGSTASSSTKPTSSKPASSTASHTNTSSTKSSSTKLSSTKPASSTASSTRSSSTRSSSTKPTSSTAQQAASSTQPSWPLWPSPAPKAIMHIGHHGATVCIGYPEATLCLGHSSPPTSTTLG
jgi:hypothetical protein